MALSLRYAGSNTYEITAKEEAELRAILDGTEGGWLSIQNGDVELWIDVAIPLVLTSTSGRVSSTMYSL
ncbi:hypothetical protein [Rhodococcus qingshengii]|uniref:hypothetical protein n=1 Tax=Rhodococcus qingshengii TaxID=334542 RepID=UPI001ADF5CA6|nr:hypothetical protein [Rhodococcus qingshengii]MCQ4150252.1 hypothetical protein [Rhodococcus qingshengii]